MPDIIQRNYPLVVACLIVFCTQVATGQERTPNSCYNNQDRTCLEEIFADILAKPSPEKTRAMYLLGRLRQEAGEAEGAKDSFMMALGFGADDEMQQALNALYVSNPNVFTDPTDCLAIESEACFENIIENGQGDTVRNAQFLFGSMLIKEQPSRSAELLHLAHVAGHRTAACPLQELYAKGAEEFEANYDKSVTYGLECLFQPPFKKFDAKYFAKYEKKSGNKAYAMADNGVAWYAEGITDPDIAARLAKEYCDTSPHRRPGDPECRVINVNGTWVKDFKLIEIPDFSGSVEGLISVDGQQSYNNKYAKETGLKVFAQSKGGAWNWRSSSDADMTIESLTEDVLKRCNQYWSKRLGYPCKVVNINGSWVD